MLRTRNLYDTLKTLKADFNLSEGAMKWFGANGFSGSDAELQTAVRALAAEAKTQSFEEFAKASGPLDNVMSARRLVPGPEAEGMRAADAAFCWKGPGYCSEPCTCQVIE
jgi:hypothetical protein